MSRPILLDLFCGAGGAAAGYYRAGFDVVGVDIDPQPNYPYLFIQDDALEFLAAAPRSIAAVHASPPCQAYTHARHLGSRGRQDHPRLIEPVRQLLREVRLPYVIENVPEAPLLNPVKLCGSMFGLQVQRHRLFESNVPLAGPACNHKAFGVPRFPSTPRSDGTRPLSRIVNMMASEVDHALLAWAMGIDWIPPSGRRPVDALRAAIPPAYTEHIGRQLLAHLQTAEEAA